MALKKIDSLQTPKSTKPPEKRRKVNPLGGIVTSDEQFEELISEGKWKEQTKKEKKARPEKKKKEDKPTKKRTGDDQTSPPLELSFEDDYFEDDDKEERPENEEKILFPPKNTLDAYEYLSDVWKHLNPPVQASEILGKVVGVVYYSKEKPHFFIGKIKQRFLYDKDGPAKEFLVEAFKKAATSTSTMLEEVPMHLMDIEVYPAHDVICGPLTASVLRGSKWSVPDYPLAHKTFNVVQSLKREEQYHHLFIRNDNWEGLYVPDKA